MTSSMESRKPPTLSRIIAGIAMSLLLLGAVGWWLVGQRVWTDDRSIRLPDSAVEIREILWTKPQSIDVALGQPSSNESIFNTEADEYEPAISPDGTELFFVRGLPADKGESQADIYISQRINNRWSKPQPLAAINTEANELGPRLSHDGDWLYFYSDRAGGLGGYDIWASPRTDTGWGEAVNLGEAINSPHNEFNPAPTPDGQRLFFASNRKAASAMGDSQRWNATIRHNPAATDYDILVAMVKRQEVETESEAAAPIESADSLIAAPMDAASALAQYEPAIEVAPLNSPHHEGSASVTTAGDFLYFTSNREGLDQGYDLYRCRLRPADARGISENDPRIIAGLYFGTIERISELSSPVDEADPSLASQGFRLLFSSNASTGQGGYDLYVADSREVFVDRDSRSLPSLGWSWWVLLAAVALLLLLLFLFRKIDSEKLGLLQKCLIVSLFVHLIITILLSFFWLTKDVYEQIVEQEQEMRIAMNLDATTELDLRLSTRSQQANLPVQAPAISESTPQSTPVEVTHAAPIRQIEIDIPAARSAPGESSMVLPAASKPSPAPAPTPTVPSAALPATALPPSISLPAAAAPLTPVADSNTPAAAQPTEADRQSAPAPTTEAATASAPAVTPTQSTPTATTATQPTPAKATPQAQAMQHQPSPAPAATDAPAPAPQFETQQTKAAQPSAPAISDASTTAPQRTQMASSSAAESAPATAQPSQASPRSMASASPAPTPSKSTAQAPAPSSAQAPMSAQPIASPAVESQPVRSEKAQGIRVTEATRPMAERAATQPQSEAGQVVVDAPPARSVDQPHKANAEPTTAKAMAAAVTASAQSLPLTEPAVQTQPITSAKLAASESTAPPEASSTSLTTAQRIAADVAAPTAASEAGNAPPAAAPAKPQAASLAKADRAASQSATTSERPVTQSTAPAAALPDITSTPFASKAIAPVDGTITSDAQVKAPSSSEKPSSATSADRTNDQAQMIDAQAPAASSSAARTLATHAEESRAASKAVAASADSKVAASLPTTPFDIDTTPVSKLSRVTGKSSALRDSADDAASPALSKATAKNEIGKGASIEESTNRLAPTADDALASLTGKQSSADLRARVSTVATSVSSDPFLAPLNEALGPGKFASPAPLFQRSPAMREKLLTELGGTPESEDAVSRALAYLARNQEPDGRWTLVTADDRGPGKRGKYPHDTALTGLAILTFLGADHTPAKPGPYREQIAKAIDYLIARGDGKGDFRGDGNMYDQGIVGIALAEAALMTGDARTRDAALAAARFIAKAQDPKSGGWRYRPGEYGDTSVLGWQIMALHSAEHLGFELSSDLRERTAKWLELVSQRNSLAAGYQQGGPSPAMTAEAVFARILLNQTFNEKQLRSFEQYMFENPASKGERDYYYIYYATLSFNQLQGASWPKWNEPTRQLLIKEQRRGGKEDGSWKIINRWDQKGGQIYTTCMAALTLEVYYRYLPMYGGPRKAAE